MSDYSDEMDVEIANLAARIDYAESEAERWQTAYMDARARIAAVRALCTARVPHPDHGAVPGQAYEPTLRVRLIDTDAVLAALEGGERGE